MNTSINVNGKQMRLPNVMEMNGKGYILKKKHFVQLGVKNINIQIQLNKKIAMNIQRTSKVMSE